MQNLVIVESPTKARTLSKFLGSKYRIEASMGHIRDLPKGELGVDVEDDFKPKYIIPRDKRKKVNELKKLAGDAQTLWLATDPDREGEAISWHIEHILNEDKKHKPQVYRVVFHEITEGAIKEAFDHPRELDLQLIDAQQARRVLDRLVGYKLSPLLWRKVKRGLSAGRVQTVALRLITEREKEILAFVPVEYWSIDAELETDKSEKFFAGLIEKNGQKLAVKNPDENQKNNFFLDAKQEADAIVKDLEKAEYVIVAVNKKETRRYSPAPFITSTLQQVAGNRLGFTAKRTMMLAQNLYEQGLITYMRTDSVNLSSSAVSAARDLIKQNYGDKYLPEKSKSYTSKSKNAQEAHEAIRPTNLKLAVDNLGGDGLSRDHRRLYDLIWKRTVASQMTDAVFDQTAVDIDAQSKDSPNKYLLRANGSVLKFDGWLKLYGVKQEIESDSGEDHIEAASREGKQVLPEMSEKDGLNLLKLYPEQHFTQPPPRFTEASLIKKLEELGIGRPSTYAPILSTLSERFYIEKQERKLVPTPLGTTVADFLVKYFPDIFDYEFTASMEDALDDVARGERKWQQTIGDFYRPFESKLETTEEKAERVKLAVETVDKNCPECGKQLVVRTGKFGKFLACSGFPDCKYTEKLEEILDVKCPQDGGEIVVKKTRKGKSFYGCKNWPNCKFASWTKPKAAGTQNETLRG